MCMYTSVCVYLCMRMYAYVSNSGATSPAVVHQGPLSPLEQDIIKNVASKQRRVSVVTIDARIHKLSFDEALPAPGIRPRLAMLQSPDLKKT